MPTYKVKDSLTGKTLNLTGDSPPTEEELQYIFSQHSGFDAPLQQEDEDEEARLTEETIRKDPRWIELSKKVYEMNEGPDAVPLDNDEQAASYGLDYMGWFNYNLPKMGLEAAQLQSATDDQKKAFVDLMDMYDEKAPSLAGFGRAVRGVAFDPATYVGIGTFGAATAGTQALKQGIKGGSSRQQKLVWFKVLKWALLKRVHILLLITPFVSLFVFRLVNRRALILSNLQRRLLLVLVLVAFWVEL